MKYSKCEKPVILKTRPFIKLPCLKCVTCESKYSIKRNRVSTERSDGIYKNG